MKILIYLILLITNLSSTELILNRYEEGKQSVDVYHLIDNRIIKCVQTYGKGFKTLIRCRLKNGIKHDFHPRNDSYYDIKFNDKEVIFYAKAYSKLIGIDEKLIVENKIRKIHKYKHWVIIGSEKEPKILSHQTTKVFNYPITVAKQKTPYISALDLNGEPIKNKKGAILLSQIKKLYKLKKYRALIAKSHEYLKKYNDTFTSDINLYMLRAQMHLAKDNKSSYENITQASLDWIAKNPSNEHIPEVYKYVIESYFKRGRFGIGEKYLQILKSAFSDNKFTQEAEISFADTIYKSKKRRKEALKTYKNVLYATKDINVASLAAMQIANTYLDFHEPKKASNIFDKIFKSNKSYINSMHHKSYILAKKFSDAGKYDIAIKIVKQLLDKDKKEEYMKNIAYWFEKSKNYSAAIQMYDKYIKKYKNGQYIGFVKEHLDGLMVYGQETNTTKKLEFLDKIMKKYKETPIYYNALKEKIKILFSEQKYNDILGLKDELIRNGLSRDLNKSVYMLLTQSLNQQKCTKAITLKDEYNITIEKQYDNKLYHCLVKVGRYKDALKIVKRNVNTKNLPNKLQWLYNSVQIYSKLDLNKKVALAGEDVLKLSQILGITKYDNVLYAIADAYYNLNDYDDLMLQTVQRIEKRFPSDVKNIDLFMKVLKYAQNKKDMMLIINYAKKVIHLQKKYNLHVYSPKVEIQYMYALKKIGKPKTALQEAQKLNHEQLNDIQKAEIFYLEGDLSITLGKNKQARKYFLKCGEIVQDNAWQKMCAEHLKLLDE